MIHFILKNTFIKFVEHVITTFTFFCGVFVGISIFLLQTPLQLRQSLIYQTVSIRLFIILLLRISQKYNVFKARVMSRSPRFNHYKLLLNVLHWLPTRRRILFKICTISYQELSCKQQSYLDYLLTQQENMFTFDRLVMIFLSLKLILLVVILTHLLCLDFL